MTSSPTARSVAARQDSGGNNELRSPINRHSSVSRRDNAGTPRRQRRQAKTKPITGHGANRHRPRAAGSFSRRHAGECHQRRRRYHSHQPAKSCRHGSSTGSGIVTRQANFQRSIKRLPESRMVPRLQFLARPTHLAQQSHGLPARRQHLPGLQFQSLAGHSSRFRRLRQHQANAPNPHRQRNPRRQRQRLHLHGRPAPLLSPLRKIYALRASPGRRSPRKFRKSLRMRQRSKLHPARFRHRLRRHVRRRPRHQNHPPHSLARHRSRLPAHSFQRSVLKRAARIAAGRTISASPQELSCASAITRPHLRRQNQWLPLARQSRPTFTPAPTIS